MLTDVWVEEVNKVSIGVIVINVRADVVIDALTGVWDVTIDVVSDIGDGVLISVNANVLVAAMADL